MTGKPSFDQYIDSLSPVDTSVAGAEPTALAECEQATAAIQAARPLDQGKLEAIIAADPAIAPVLAAAAGLSQERFKGWLTQRFKTQGWVTLARRNAAGLAEALDEDLDLIATLEAQASRTWTWADVLARTMSPRQRANASIEQGRLLEDAVEEVIEGLKLPFAARTRFDGTRGRTGPADFAIPSTGPGALIAIGVKGFDSTGSKLTDAATEIQSMADVRKPTQFIYAVVDGVGWLRRKNDLRRIHTLWVEDRIDGVYNLSTMPAFATALGAAARRLGLL